MKMAELTQGWQMRCTLDKEWQEARVPGSVYTDLLTNGRIRNPYWKDNEDSICALMNEDYEYECRFVPEKELLEEEKIVLHFDGLDTIADIYLNGAQVGDAYSMHRIWEYDLSDKLSEGENVLMVHFHSPL